MADLGTSPPSNSYVSKAALDSPEKWYPLKIYVCEDCWLAQTVDFVDRSECFSSNYAYFSSCSTSWLRHAEEYVQNTQKRFGLDKGSLVAELASNDGYLLQYFHRDKIPCYGVEPTKSTALAATEKGLDIVTEFFGSQLAQKLLVERGPLDLLVANNVLAHVPDINDFVAGIVVLLKRNGVATFEFPHLSELLQRTYFDTIYHEHFSYLSLHAVTRIFSEAGLKIFDVEELETHGGSLRVYACLQNDAFSCNASVDDFLSRERAGGLLHRETYLSMQGRIDRIKNQALRFLIGEKEAGRSIAAYGAAAKGNALLNYAGIRHDLLPYVVDRSVGKIGKYLPGSRIPIVSEDHLQLSKPQTILILPWNLRGEIASQLSYAREWGARFAVVFPELEIF